MRATLLFAFAGLTLTGACIALMSLRRTPAARTTAIATTMVPPAPPVPAAPPPRVTLTPEELVAAVDRRYGTFLRASGLAAVENDRLRELLIERQIVTVDAVNAANGGGLDLRSELARIRPDVEAAQTKVEEKIRQRFGETFYRRYREFDDTVAERNTVGRLQRMLGPTMTPLTAEQAHDMVRVLKHFHGRTSAGGLDGLIYGGVDYEVRVSDETIAGAGNVLAPLQLEKLRLLKQEQERSDAIATPAKTTK
jgi:hypothetical protein